MIGANGKVAGLVLPQLKKQGHNITGLVQDGDKGKQAIASGADQFAIGELRVAAGADCSCQVKTYPFEFIELK